MVLWMRDHRKSSPGAGIGAGEPSRDSGERRWSVFQETAGEMQRQVKEKSGRLRDQIPRSGPGGRGRRQDDHRAVERAVDQVGGKAVVGAVVFVTVRGVVKTHRSRKQGKEDQLEHGNPNQRTEHAAQETGLPMRQH